MSVREDALQSGAWPFKEAETILKRLSGKTPEKGHVILETGYGASGLPHMGTFGEVVRTTMVRRAFGRLSDIPTRLVCFSDDMDGLRKVPTNIPNREALEPYLGRPLTAIPDPFGTHESFGHHNNARLRSFLDHFGFEYDFYSATECYRSGRFDPTLREILQHYEEIRRVILPTLGDERRKTYSPFLPICPKSGQVLQVPLISTDSEAGTVTFEDIEGERQTVPVTGGHVKCQWKVDWAMRWHALDVDYEMAGKDLIESVRLSGTIVRILGGRPPEGFSYELFLDENGEKISKSKGNGLTIDEWLKYASPESLSLFMYQSPRKAKRLYFDIIPKTVDEYYTHVRKFPDQDPVERLANPAYHIHGGPPPRYDIPVNFALLLNLVSAAHTQDKAALWDYVERYAPGAGPASHPELDRLMDYALKYYDDFVRPTKSYRLPDDTERAAMNDLLARLDALPPDADAETIMSEVYAAGKAHPFDNLRDWFRALYECLLGQSQGPRMGSFIALYGIEETKRLIEQVLDGESPE